MQVDALTLTALADELRETLRGARIDDVIQPTPQSVALQCYGGASAPGAPRNRWLLASAHPQFTRLHTVEQKPRKLVTEPPAFVMLLRKYLEGSRIVAIRQPPWERILEIGFAHTPPSTENPDPETWLILEAMGQLSNLILRDASGMILGALRQVSADVNRYRAIAPNVRYRDPPPQTRTLNGATVPKLEGAQVADTDLQLAAEELLHQHLTTAQENGTEHTAGKQNRKKRGKAPALTVTTLLTSQIAGWSRDLAAEVIARAFDRPDAGDVPLSPDLPWEALAREVRSLASLPATHAWHPTLVYPAAPPFAGSSAASSPARLPLAFAVYLPLHYVDVELRAMPGVNAMLAAYYENAEWRGAVEGAKRDLQHILQTNRDRTLRKAEALRGELAALDEAQRLRQEADILLAFQTEIPAHVSSYAMQDPFGEGDASSAETITIALDPRLDAVENANKKYDRYHKLQRAALLIPPQIEANDLELARIEQLRTDLTLAETPAEIAPVRAEVAEAGYIRGSAARSLGKQKGIASKQSKAGKQGKGGKNIKGGQPPKRGPDGGAPLRRQSSDGMTLLVGKNSRQNEEVTFHEASANDTWLHARGVPGAHIIIKSGGRSISEDTLREAAALAAYYSQAREAGSVPVDYTQQRYVRHMKGGGPGMVIYERERTLHVAPADPSTYA